MKLKLKLTNTLSAALLQLLLLPVTRENRDRFTREIGSREEKRRTRATDSATPRCELMTDGQEFQASGRELDDGKKREVTSGMRGDGCCVCVLQHGTAPHPPPKTRCHPYSSCSLVCKMQIKSYASIGPQLGRYVYKLYLKTKYND